MLYLSMCGVLRWWVKFDLWGHYYYSLSFITRTAERVWLPFIRAADETARCRWFFMVMSISPPYFGRYVLRCNWNLLNNDKKDPGASFDFSNLSENEAAFTPLISRHQRISPQLLLWFQQGIRCSPCFFVAFSGACIGTRSIVRRLFLCCAWLFVIFCGVFPHCTPQHYIYVEGRI